MLNQNDLDSLVDDIKPRGLLTPQDPNGMSYILSKLCGRRMSIHGFWFNCALFRMHGNPETYEVLTKHANALQPGGHAPDWAGEQTTLAQLYSKREVRAAVLPIDFEGGQTQKHRMAHIQVDEDACAEISARRSRLPDGLGWHHRWRDSAWRIAECLLRVSQDTLR